MTLQAHLSSLPSDLANSLEGTYSAAVEHFIKGEPDDCQVDAGRFCEAALRYLEFKMSGEFTPIDGKSKPNRKKTVNAAKSDTTLPPTLRAQAPQAIELVMDFRNNRNSAHLGSLDASQTDAACVVQNLSWLMAEFARLESNDTLEVIQALVDSLSRMHVPLVQEVDGVPIVLDADMNYENQVLVLLYQQGVAVSIKDLQVWTGHSNITRFRNQVIEGLKKKKYVAVSKDGLASILYPGEAAAQALLVGWNPTT